MPRTPVAEKALARLDSQGGTAAADGYLALAADPHPDDVANPAELQVQAALLLQDAGEHERALQVLREAAASGAPVYPDVRAYLSDGLLHAGRADEAAEVARAIRAERPSDPYVHTTVGAAFEQNGDLRTALRWYTIGLNKLLDEPPADEDETLHGVLHLLAAKRFSVRRQLDLPIDGLDLVSTELAESHHHDD
jgi:tetratricopeptide (TPR) repeat protein